MTTSLLLAALASAGGVQLAAEPVVSGLQRPVDLTSPPGDARLFVCEQHTGHVRIVEDGALLVEPFLDLSGQVATFSEQGLLGMVFHPDYDENGFVFVNYIDAVSGGTRIVRYTRDAVDDAKVDPQSATLVLELAQPEANHNAGQLAFGPLDGYLYIPFGDGGGGNDPFCNAQNPATWLGKMLRIDVDALPYSVPPDNPFLGQAVFRPEIWSFGLRNPWRFAFDRVTGDMYIGDVGQANREEIIYEPALAGGANYGWKVMEGFICSGDDGCPVAPPGCASPAYTDPIHEYTHVGFFGPCAVVGGKVYRGCAMPELDGTYFFADHCSDDVWSFRYDGSIQDYANRTLELQPQTGILTAITSFGEDAFGELYVMTLLGDVFKIVPATPPAIDDCDGDGLDDGCAVAMELVFDLDGEGTPDTCQDLSADSAAVSLSAGGTQNLALHAGAGAAGSVYLVLGSLSGTAPGIFVDGVLVPLNPDFYGLYTLSEVGAPPLSGSTGALDGQGEASAAFTAAPGLLPVALVGASAAHAYVMLDGALSVTGASNPVTLQFLP